jgi:hypothetical protein
MGGQENTNARQRPGASLRRWRRCQAFGGFLLACSFFLPVVDGCNTAIYPASFFVEALTSLGTTSLDEVLAACLMAVPAYLFGALITLHVTVNRRIQASRPPTHAPIYWTILASIATLQIVMVSELIADAAGGPMAYDVGYTISAGISLFAAAYLWRSGRESSAPELCVRWFGSVCCTAWFCWLALFASPRWGLAVSMIGALAVVIGTVAEAVILGRFGAARSLRGLVTGGYQIADPGMPNCRRCGYILVGLPEPRCPECGTPFTPEQTQENRIATAGS